MLAFHDRASIEGALSSDLDTRLRGLIAASIKQDIRPVQYDLTDYTSVVIVQAGDTDDEICCEVGFSPLANLADDIRQQRGVLKDHGDWFEITFTIGNDGFAYVLFVQDAEGVDRKLLALCRSLAR